MIYNKLLNALPSCLLKEWDRRVPFRAWIQNSSIQHLIWPGLGIAYHRKSTTKLRNTQVKSLELPAGDHLQSIGFPCISTGVYGYPKEEVARVALTAIYNWFGEHKDYGMQVTIVNFNEADHEIYKKVWKTADEGK